MQWWTAHFPTKHNAKHRFDKHYAVDFVFRARDRFSRAEKDLLSAARAVYADGHANGNRLPTFGIEALQIWVNPRLTLLKIQEAVCGRSCSATPIGIMCARQKKARLSGRA
jgi:hypothetical protein